MLGEYVTLHHKVESRKQMGEASPEKFVPILRVQNALASAQGSLGIAAAARQMRRLLGPMGKSVRLDVLLATGKEDKAKST